MANKLNNYAFIDGQNLHMGIQKLGWDLDYQRFRIYLKEKYRVMNAYLFIGFISANQKLYAKLQSSGFILVFKPTSLSSDRKIKGNVDADLVLKTMIECSNYEKAIIVSSDGDFYSLVEHLYFQNKLEAVLSTDRNNCPHLLWRSANGKIQFLKELKGNVSAKAKRGTS